MIRLTLLAALLGAGCAASPRRHASEFPPFVFPPPLRLVCNGERLVDLREVLPQVREEHGISIRLAQGLQLRVYEDADPAIGTDLIGWLRARLAPYALGITRQGSAWVIGPDPELGPTLKELRKEGPCVLAR